MLAHCMIRGIAQGVLPLIGYGYSSGDHRRMRSVVARSAAFSAWAYLCVSFFQAVGQGRRSFLLTCCRKGLVDIPLMLLLRLVSPVFGPCWATPAADLFCCGLAALLFFRFVCGLAKEPELCYAKGNFSSTAKEVTQHEA